MSWPLAGMVRAPASKKGFENAVDDRTFAPAGHPAERNRPLPQRQSDGAGVGNRAATVVRGKRMPRRTEESSNVAVRKRMSVSDF